MGLLTNCNCIVWCRILPTDNRRIVLRFSARLCWVAKSMQPNLRGYAAYGKPGNRPLHGRHTGRLQKLDRRKACADFHRPGRERYHCTHTLPEPGYATSPLGSIKCWSSLPPNGLALARRDIFHGGGSNSNSVYGASLIHPTRWSERDWLRDGFCMILQESGKAV